jgi:hypothetical protein
LNDKKLILDACCGGRMFWFDKNHKNTIYVDNRTANKGHIQNGYNPNHEVNPDLIMDFRDLKFPDNSFKLVIFDPPHLTNPTKKSILRKKYGILDKNNWKQDLSKGFSECWRVLDNHGTLIFKWSETNIKLREVLSCFNKKPIIGHPRGKTIWCVFFKND